MSSTRSYVHLTEKTIVLWPAEECIVFDKETPCLAFRVRANGRKTYIFDMTRNGRRHRNSLGACSAIRLDAAREMARQMAERLENGETPRVVTPDARTFQAVAQRWLAEYAKPRLRSWKTMQFQLGQQYCGPLYNIPIEKVSRRHIREITGPMTATRPSMANAIYRTISAMMTWAVKQEIIDINPCLGVDMPAPIVSRERFLSPAELRSFWRATSRLTFPARELFQVLALTGQRRKEVAGMRWDEMDLDKAIWTLPAVRTKNGKTHDVPLSPPVMQIIASAPRNGPCVFAGATGVMSLVTRHLYPAKTFIDGAMPPGTPRWTPHDLRRTFSTWCAQQGYPQHVVEKILNHNPKHITGVAAIYNRYEYMDERRACLDAWAAHLLSLEDAGVVSLRVVM